MKTKKTRVLVILPAGANVAELEDFLSSLGGIVAAKEEDESKKKFSAEVFWSGEATRHHRKEEDVQAVGHVGGL
jgi:hypothetical protein